MHYINLPQGKKISVEGDITTKLASLYHGYRLISYVIHFIIRFIPEDQNKTKQDRLYL